MTKNENKYLKQKSLKVAYLDLNSRAASLNTFQLEKQLTLVADINLQTIQNTEQILKEFNLLIVNSLSYDSESFAIWLTQFKRRMESNFTIWIPALILANADTITLHDLFLQTYQSNWYFDIIHPEHIDSLPIRLANLIRINDHIHELNRYEQKLESLHKKVDDLQQKLTNLKTK